ncbi:MAG: N-acyl homoserine lactonase family protein [Chloroflexi bacterium]|nr:N-acyl homoserine lactonase family protein [Chloroflexota bacterium]
MIDTEVKSVSLLPLGMLTLDQSVLTHRQFPGQKVDCPVIAAFIEMADGEHILFDTGLPPAFLEDDDFLPANQANTICGYTVEDDIRNRLRAVGAMPADVKIVVNSHFHWDHSGANYLFPHARFLVQEKEYRFARQPDAFINPAYTPKLFDIGAETRLMPGDEVIKPGILAITTPGHTPGHQSLMIMLPSERAMILTGDAMMCPANLDPALPPGNAHTTEQAVASIQRLKALADFHDGELVICHDPALWDKWKPAPHVYA